MVSIIIATKNRLDLLRQTVQSVLSNTYEEYELIVVNDASVDGTEEYLKTLPDGVRVVNMPDSKGCGAAKNAGAAIANGKFLYFSDNDVYFDDGWLEKLIYTYHEHKNYGLRILGGDYHPHHGEAERREVFGQVVRYSDQQPGFSMLMTKEHFNLVGPFTHGEVGKYGIEDTDICLKTTNAGFKVGSVVPHVIYHCGITNSDGEKTAGYEHFIYDDLPDGVIQI